jgi:hypothetical protein
MTRDEKIDRSDAVVVPIGLFRRIYATLGLTSGMLAMLIAVADSPTTTNLSVRVAGVSAGCFGGAMFLLGVLGAPSWRRRNFDQLPSTAVILNGRGALVQAWRLPAVTLGGLAFAFLGFGPRGAALVAGISLGALGALVGVRITGVTSRASQEHLFVAIARTWVPRVRYLVSR